MEWRCPVWVLLSWASFVTPIAQGSLFSEGGTTVVPIGYNGTFTCSTGSQFPAWQISTIAVFPMHSGSSQGGIYIAMLESTGDNHTSILTIEGSIDNNNTAIQCLGYTKCCTVNFGDADTLTFQVFDIPSAPANVEFLPSNSLDTLLISWSAPFSPLSVPLSYQLEISPDSGDPLDPMPTNSTSMLITLPQQSCSPIQIRAFAINAAGSGNSSATIDAFLLSSTTLEEISQSTQHELEMSDEMNVTIIISFMPPVFCSYYQNSTRHIYYLVLTELSSEREPLSRERLGPFVPESVDHMGKVHWPILIMPNSIFSYIIQLEENITISDSDNNTFVTTDVQDSYLLVNYDQYSLEVFCLFHASSRAQGCVFELNGTFGYHYLNLTRVKDMARYIHRETGPLGKFTYSVYDWEEDGSVGGVSVLVGIRNVTINPTTDTAGGNHTPTSVGREVPLYLPPTIAVVVSAVLIVSIMATIAIILFIRNKAAARVRSSHEENGTKESKMKTKASPHNSSFGESPTGRQQEDPYDNVYDRPQHKNENSLHISLSSTSPPPPLPTTFPPPLPSSSPPTTRPPPITCPPSSPSPTAPTPLWPDTANEGHYAELTEERYSRINESPYYHVLESPPTTSEVPVSRPHRLPPLQIHANSSPFTSPTGATPPAGATFPSPATPFEQSTLSSHVYSEVHKVHTAKASAK